APSKEERAEEYFLRVKIKAGDSGNAGTDADVRVKFDDEAEQLADYSPKRFPLLGHNDHEKGAEAVYAFGPFSSLPQK
ncbi:MAG TPA: hypothetical protein VGB45_07275, partial [Abditibacterium sp.]